MKAESLVIADQHAAVNTFPGLVHTAHEDGGIFYVLVQSNFDSLTVLEHKKFRRPHVPSSWKKPVEHCRVFDGGKVSLCAIANGPVAQVVRAHA